MVRGGPAGCRTLPRRILLMQVKPAVGAGRYRGRGISSARGRDRPPAERAPAGLRSVLVVSHPSRLTNPLKLQTATSLALVSVLEAAANPGRTIAAAEIAEKYGVSIHHLAKVLRELAHAELVESARSVGGGYRFAGNAKRVTLMDVIEQFEDINARSPDAGGAEPATGVGRARAS